MHLRYVSAALALASLVVAACAPGTGGGTSAATTYDVQVDNKSTAFNFQATAYFPDAFKVHPGDTIRFKAIDRGEPHTVTFGTMVDAAVASLAKRPAPAPNAPPPPEPPELAKLPTLIGDPPALPVAQSAAQPCFLATGAPPSDVKAACAKDQQSQKDFDGTQTFFNSGWLAPDQIFALKLADGIKPGTYSFICLLHRDTMTGQLTVVDKGQPADTADALKGKSDKQLTDLVAKLKGPVDASAKATPDRAQAGLLTPEANNIQALIFAPKDIAIPVGGSVTWTILGPHTITFNPPQDAVGVLAKAADGTVSLNFKALGPAGGPGQPPPPAPPAAGAPPPPPPPGPIVIDAGKWDGKGFHNSGIFVSFPPVIFGYKLTFTTAGTYPFRCVIHPDMEGTVKVGQ
jgi:plastocyanin